MPAFVTFPRFRSSDTRIERTGQLRMAGESVPWIARRLLTAMSLAVALRRMRSTEDSKAKASKSLPTSRASCRHHTDGSDGWNPSRSGIAQHDVRSNAGVDDASRSQAIWSAGGQRRAAR